jgi:hypothetical protein
VTPPAGTICSYCRDHPATVYDHVVPKARGGTDALSNRAPACDSCNRAKGGDSLADFLARGMLSRAEWRRRHPCPTCGASIGHNCKALSGQPWRTRNNFHPERAPIREGVAA